MNCERIKLSKTIYDMGMKVAAVSLMCQDERVFRAMEMAGTPCPYEGMIGSEAQQAWIANIDDRPDAEEYKIKIEKENKVADEKADGKASMTRKIKNGQSYWQDFWKMCKHEKNPNGSLKSKKTCKAAYERVSSKS